jgi:hypothetical protein
MTLSQISARSSLLERAAVAQEGKKHVSFYIWYTALVAEHHKIVDHFFGSFWLVMGFAHSQAIAAVNGDGAVSQRPFAVVSQTQ